MYQFPSLLIAGALLIGTQPGATHAGWRCQHVLGSPQTATAAPLYLLVGLSLIGLSVLGSRPAHAGCDAD